MSVRVVALIDGEHHPGVARDAVDRLERDHELSGVLFVGGEEKVPAAVLDDPVAHYGRPVVRAGGDPAASLGAMLEGSAAEAIFDLSGEPVLDGSARFRLASVALHFGLRYRAAGFELAPPPKERLAYDGPILAVIGTGKRTGKTAVAGHCASLMSARGLEPVIVSMGRGGPPEPVLVRADERPDLDKLLEIVRGGGHAASDYLEDAVLAGVSTVGCRRCGEGPAGETFDSNVVAGARLAATLEPDVILLEGSGAAFPPVEAHRTICVTSAERAPVEALSYLGPYRLLESHLVALTGADRLERSELEQLKRELRPWSDRSTVVALAFEPEPAGHVEPGARAALFTTAPAERESDLRRHLARRGVDVRVFSPNLARRAALARDLERAERERCDVFLTELKATAVEIVACRARELGVALTFVRNRPVPLPGEPDLEGEIERLLDEARAEARSKAVTGQPAVAGER